MNEDLGFFNNLLRDLVGERLSSVTFVADYWQLSFDNYGFSVLTTISIKRNEQSLRDGDRDFRNWLCECIMQKVVHADAANEIVQLAFENGYKVELSFRGKDYVGPEGLHFWHPKLPSLMIL